MNFLKDLNLEYRESNIYGGQWLWPADDVSTWKYLHKHTELPLEVIKKCQTRNLIIQAGGNAGLYPKIYSKYFETVMTFEPDYKNFFCLTHNVSEENVFKFQTCLGNNFDFLDIEYNPKFNEKNRGGIRISKDNKKKIPQITIDSLNISPDVIHLDIEGYEYFALQGAEKTMLRSSPMIVLETNGSGDLYKCPQEKIDEYLKSLGYKIYIKLPSDTFYIKE
jgi:FkbM family methyltransferase